MSIVNYQNFIKFAKFDSKIQVNYRVDKGDSVNEISRSNIFKLAEFLFEDEVVESLFNMDIKKTLLNLQEAMRNNDSWSYDFDTKSVNFNGDGEKKMSTLLNDEKYLWIDFSYGEEFSYNSVKNEKIKLRVSQLALYQQMGNILMLLITENAAFPITEEFIINLHNSRNKDKYNNVDLIRYMKNLVKKGLVIYADYFVYRINHVYRAFMVYTYDIDESVNDEIKKIADYEKEIDDCKKTIDKYRSQFGELIDIQ